ncbi:hypothetical protein CMI37_04140 [Candidatus Pacearchaeota archaeon]|nr:hypothetical protein [Candidatus Pacearchaeota archaeon]
MAKTFEDTYSKMRWLIERNRLSLFRYDETATKEEDMYLNLKLDDSLDTYSVRLYGNKIAQYFDEDTTTLLEIPEQYHEAIVQKAVAWGYEIPPTQNIELAMYFHKMYEDTVTRAKKWKRTGRTGGWGKVREDNWFAK